MESYVEGLSGYLEKGMLTEEIQSKCHKTILNLIELCSTRTETLVEHVQDGYERQLCPPPPPLILFFVLVFV